MEKELILAMKEEAELEVKKLQDQIEQAQLDIIYFKARKDFAEELISRVEAEVVRTEEQESTTEEQPLYATEE